MKRRLHACNNDILEVLDILMLQISRYCFQTHHCFVIELTNNGSQCDNYLFNYSCKLLYQLLKTNNHSGLVYTS